MAGRLTAQRVQPGGPVPVQPMRRQELAGGDGRAELRHAGGGGCRRGLDGDAELSGQRREHALPVLVHRTGVAQELLEHLLRVADIVSVKNRRRSHGSLSLL